MKNSFKEYFDLERNLEGLKIHNDFTNTKRFSLGKVKTTLIVSVSSFFLIKFGLSLINNYGNIKSNFLFRWSAKLSLFSNLADSKQNSLLKLLSNFKRLKKVLNFILFSQASQMKLA
jgi:hypothetical protein